MDALPFWYALTLAGSPEYWALLAALLSAMYLAMGRLAPQSRLWKRSRPFLRSFLMVFVPGLILTLGTVFLLKAGLYFPRPCMFCYFPGMEDCNPYCLQDSAFPSGHAAAAFAFFSSMYLAARRREILPLFILPVLVSWSRVALGVHNPADILAGAFIGLLMPFLASVMLRKWHKP